MLIAALNVKKCSHSDTAENLNFEQSQLNHINNQKQKHKEHVRLVIVFIGVDVLAKIVDEFYILIKIYLILIKVTFYLSSLLCQRASIC